MRSIFKTHVDNLLTQGPDELLPALSDLPQEVSQDAGTDREDIRKELTVLWIKFKSGNVFDLVLCMFRMNIMKTHLSLTFSGLQNVFDQNGARLA